MKKIIALTAIILMSVVANAQQRYVDGVYSNNLPKMGKVTDVIDCMQLSYGHSVLASNGFNNVSELWLRIYKFECSYYWDPKDYEEYDLYDYREHYGKSYINYKKDVTQSGYCGMKLGWAFNKYFSAGLNFSYGAMAMYCETEDYHYHSLGVTDSYWTIGTYSAENYQNFGIGIYGKAQINVGHFVLFTSAQVNTNTEMVLSIGIGWAFERPWWLF